MNAQPTRHVADAPVENRGRDEPRIVAYVCNWCTYLGADLAGTNRLEYPPNVRIIRLPCTGRIDFNLLIKAFEKGADAVLVSGCHPGDCHYTSGNYHARRRWMLFRALLDAVGFDMRRIHFTWISAAEGRKFQQVITDITEQTRALGPYVEFRDIIEDRRPEAADVPTFRIPVRDARGDSAGDPAGGTHRAETSDVKPPIGTTRSDSLSRLRQTCRELLIEGKVDVIIGYGQDAPAEADQGGDSNRSGPGRAGEPAVTPDSAPCPVFITDPADVDRLVWNEQCVGNLTTYLTRKEIRALGRPAVVVKGCDARAMIVLDRESQIDRSQTVAIGLACEGVGEPPLPKCRACDVRTPRHVDITIGTAEFPASGEADRYAELDALMQRAPAERMAWWRHELARCVKCYACRQVCPLCYCERCLVDKNQPQCVDTSATLKGNFAWHLVRAFHLAGRCVGCDECTRACPAGIDLRLLNLSLARAAEEQFGYRAGMDLDAEPVVGAFSARDREDFIR